MLGDENCTPGCVKMKRKYLDPSLIRWVYTQLQHHFLTSSKWSTVDVDCDAYTLLSYAFAYVFCVHSFQDPRHPAASAASRIAAASSRRRDSTFLRIKDTTQSYLQLQCYEMYLNAAMIKLIIIERGDNKNRS